MTTVRELCRVLTMALHIPGVDAWAEELGRCEFLPGLDHEVTALDAALLLAAVVATPRPENAPRVVVMRGISAEMRFVVNAPDLPTLQQHAADLGRDKLLRPKINQLRLSKDWRDLGDLKRELLDLWTEERNAYAKEVMLDIEAQRREGLGIITIRPGSETQRKGAAR